MDTAAAQQWLADWESYLATAAEPSLSEYARILRVPRQTMQNNRDQVARILGVKVPIAGHKKTRGDLVADANRPGVSTLYKVEDEAGDIALQWVKNPQADKRDLTAEREAAYAELASRIRPLKPAAQPKRCDGDLLNCYVVTDYHLGMLSWHEETGADWDISIAEKLLINWFAAAIEQSPNAETCVLAQLGDFLHFDGLEALTPASKNVLDADTRFQKVVRVAIRLLRAVINMLLRKHRHVVVIMAEGNHDPASSVWLREGFAALYEQEPRCEIDCSAGPYHLVEHGKTALFFHHGHKRKPANIDTVFASLYREAYGRTKHAYAHMGHMHHIDARETNLMVVEQHRTLAAPDAYAARGGWVSGRDAKVITYHREHGEVGRVVVSAAQVHP